jgi:hypothetical protein
MELTQESIQHVEQLAKETLDHFDAVATAARNAIENSPSPERMLWPVSTRLGDCQKAPYIRHRHFNG